LAARRRLSKTGLLIARDISKTDTFKGGVDFKGIENAANARFKGPIGKRAVLVKSSPGRTGSCKTMSPTGRLSAGGGKKSKAWGRGEWGSTNDLCE